MREQLINGNSDARDLKRKTYYQTFLRNLSEAIHYYQNLQKDLRVNSESFSQALQAAGAELTAIRLEYSLD